MLALIVLGVIVALAFVIIFGVHLKKVNEEKRLQIERKIQDLQSQAKRFEPLITRLRPHLLPYDLRKALADRWIALLYLQQDAGDTSPEFLAYLAEAQSLVSEVKANPNPMAEPIEDKERGQEAMNLLKNLQFILMREYREGRLSETRGQEFINQVRYAATQIVIEMNQSMVKEQLRENKYRAAIVCYNNILIELKKYRGTEKEQFAGVYNSSRKAIEELKVKAKEEAEQTPNLLADGIKELEAEEAEAAVFKSDMQKALEAGKEKARQHSKA